MMYPVGASSLHMYSTAGLTNAGSNCGGGALASKVDPGTLAVMRVAAPGARQFTRTFLLTPSMANTFIKPIMPVFAAP